MYISGIKLNALIFTLLLSNFCFSQKDTLPYFRKEEIIHQGKLYRRYNNYLTAGAGFSYSGLRKKSQNNIGIDFHFHIKRQYFKAGMLMSGNEFLSNNNLVFHLGYGYRKETSKINFHAFIGPSYFTGVYGVQDTSGFFNPVFYEGIGAYISCGIVKKITYDIGLGIEGFSEINKFQIHSGIKFILFFSGSYRGLKRNINPNVRKK